MVVMNRKKQINVLLVDDHEILLDGLEAVLQAYNEIKVIGKALNGEKAIDFCKRTLPDVILMDLSMPEMDGVTTTKKISNKWPDVKIIILTSFIDKKMIKEALKVGAVGYLVKDVSAADLLDAIRDASLGKPTISKDAAKIIIEEIKAPSPDKSGLTTREKEILALLVDGLSNKEIAEQLVVSITTVKFHVGNILYKLQVSSRLEAVSLAVKDNLV
jgi:NarL family two-component system response regulator LiaR